MNSTSAEINFRMSYFRISDWRPCCLIQFQRDHIARKPFLIVNGVVEEEPLQNGLWPILFNPMPRLQDQFTHLDPCRADCLAIAAIKAMVHVPYEFFRSRAIARL